MAQAKQATTITIQMALAARDLAVEMCTRPWIELLELEEDLGVFGGEAVSWASEEEFLILLTELPCQVLIRHQRVLIIHVIRLVGSSYLRSHSDLVPHPLLTGKLLTALSSGEELDLVRVITGPSTQVS